MNNIWIENFHTIRRMERVLDALLDLNTEDAHDHINAILACPIDGEYFKLVQALEDGDHYLAEVKK